MSLHRRAGLCVGDFRNDILCAEGGGMDLAGGKDGAECGKMNTHEFAQMAAGAGLWPQPARTTRHVVHHDRLNRLVSLHRRAGLCVR